MVHGKALDSRADSFDGARCAGCGITVADVARALGCSLRTVKRVMAGQDKREQRRTRWCPEARRLSLREREEISVGLRRGDSSTAIAAHLGRSTSTVSREVNTNGGRDGYRAWRAGRSENDVLYVSPTRKCR